MAKGSKTAKEGDIKTRLAAAAQAMALLKQEVLEELKANHRDTKRPDFLWHYLLQSHSTLGGVSGWRGLMANRDNYEKVTYESIEKCPKSRRTRHVHSVLRAARVRYPNTKAKQIVQSHAIVVEMGGNRAASRALLKATGREGKLEFLKQFPGIGDKYARNIMMDVYHEDFRNVIAIDSRIQGISNAWGLAFGDYLEHEAFYLGVASIAEISGWELDRLMFRFPSIFMPPLSLPVGS